MGEGIVESLNENNGVVRLCGKQRELSHMGYM